ncbi:hypothetical protein Prum_000560 [Phytohabitans rumicis]|uniref:Uncharacterized protein n=1 Tax=Phytohabitans rumicis TaxID=1076125 RepID=A0A6V8KRD9_9ACTN|nr:hypothetical protein Prum_000560 [Phytohabitans rumicis]
MRGGGVRVPINLHEYDVRDVAVLLDDVEAQHTGLGQGRRGVHRRGGQELLDGLGADPYMDVDDKHPTILPYPA